VKRLLLIVVVATAGLMTGCGEPDPSTQPGFVKETASDPMAVMKQMGKDSKPGAATTPEGGATGAPAGGTDAAKP